jgi:transposase
VKGGYTEEMNWNNEREYERLILYMSGFSDFYVGVLSAESVEQPDVYSWRRRRKLPKNEPMDFRTDEEIKRETEKEEQLISLYNDGLSDPQIAKIMKVTKSTIKAWRMNRGLSPNAKQGWQEPVDEPVYKGVDKTEKVLSPNAVQGTQQVQNGEHRIRKKRETKKARDERARKLAEQEEAVVVGFLPTKEEILKMVRDSPGHKVTTAQLIKQGYGDVGQSRGRGRGRGHTVHNLRELEKEGLIELDTDSEKGQIIWRA